MIRMVCQIITRQSMNENGQIIVSTSDIRSRLKRPDAHSQSASGNQNDSAQSGSQTLHPRPRLSTEYVAPRNEIESQVASIWQELLGIRGIGVLDDFLELGGDSLLAGQVISRVRADFAVEINTQKLFDNPRVADLAILIGATRWDETGETGEIGDIDDDDFEEGEI